MTPFARLKRRLGLKERVVTRCAVHTWRRVYGDERLAAGAPYVCRRCPATTQHG